MIKQSSLRGGLVAQLPPGRRQGKHRRPAWIMGVFVVSIHVRKGSGKGKFWLEPVSLAWARGLAPRELSRAREIVLENRTLLSEAWNEHFGSPA